MKQTLYKSFMAAGAVLMLAGCANDEPFNNGVTGADASVTFKVEMPQAFGTRAINDGLKATNLTVVVFDKNGDFVFQEDRGEVFKTGLVQDVKVDLISGETYTVAFWVDAPVAAGENDPYTITDGVLSIDYDHAKANDDRRDAFYASRQLTVNATSVNQSITLYRPFAQVNLGAEDYTYVTQTMHYNPTQTEVSMSGCAYAGMNLCDGEVVGSPVDVTFAMATMPEYDAVNNTPANLTVNATPYAWIGMNYILCDKLGGTLTNLTFKTNDSGICEQSYTQGAPVKRNMRTNIYGKIFTTSTNWNVEVDPAIVDKDTPLALNSDNVYEISSPQDLYKIEVTAKNANRPGDTRTKFKLTKDIDMTGYVWEPINVTMIDLDGDGHTISNVTTGTTWRSGIFGYAGCVEFHDITLENIHTSGAQAGVIFGSFDGGKYDNLKNVTIKGYNTVKYVPYSSASYTEDWGAVGALFGVLSRDQTAEKIDITIDADAVIEIDTNGIVTKLTNRNDYCYFNAGISVLEGVTNNGTIRFVSKWDGTTVEAPAVDASGNMTISTAAQLAYLQHFISEKTNNMEGKTITLTSDIDLQGYNWIPMGLDATASEGARRYFYGTFDGNGHTIRNLNIDYKYVYNGEAKEQGNGFFFRLAKSAVVKNLTFEDAVVKGSNGDYKGTFVGVLAGYIMGGTVENVTFKNCKVNSFGSCGIVAGCITNAPTPVTLKDVTVEGGSVETVYHGGGLAGIVQKDITETNCTVNGVTWAKDPSRKYETYNTTVDGQAINGDYWVNNATSRYAGFGKKYVRSCDVVDGDLTFYGIPMN